MSEPCELRSRAQISTKWLEGNIAVPEKHILGRGNINDGGYHILSIKELNHFFKMFGRNFVAWNSCTFGPSESRLIFCSMQGEAAASQKIRIYNTEKCETHHLYYFWVIAGSQ